jgi:hypothetical protein
MFETDPVAVVTVAQESARTLAMVGPPGGLPAPVPDFVGNILGEIGSALGMDGLGETISGLTPGGEGSAEVAAGQ